MRNWIAGTVGVLMMLSAGCDNPTAPELKPVEEVAELGGGSDCEDPSCAPNATLDGTTVSLWFDGQYLKGQSSMRYFGNFGRVTIQISAHKNGNSVTSPELATELRTLTFGNAEFLQSPIAQLYVDDCGVRGEGSGRFRAEVRTFFGETALRFAETTQPAMSVYNRSCSCTTDPKQPAPGESVSASSSLTAADSESALSCAGPSGSGGGGTGITGYVRTICVTTYWGYYDTRTGKYEILGVDSYCYTVWVNQSIMAGLSDGSAKWSAGFSGNGSPTVTLIATGANDRAAARVVWLSRPGSQPYVVVDTTRATIEDVAKAIVTAEVLAATRNQPPSHDLELVASSVEWNENWASARGGIAQMLGELRSASQQNVPGFGRVRALTIPLPRSGEFVRR